MITTDEIKALEPGRKLDAIVAEIIMGWTDITRPSSFASAMADYPGMPPGMKRHSDRVSVPRYSTNKAEALQVIDKMRSLGFTTHINIKSADSSSDFECQVRLDKRLHRPGLEPSWIGGLFNGDLAHATCIASLLAFFMGTKANAEQPGPSGCPEDAAKP